MSFKDIKGQDKPIERLQKSIRQKQLAGAYLFVGPQGIGKKITAKTLAKALNCEKDDFDSCDSCASCLKIEKQQHPDIHFIESEDSELIKIESIRQLQREISLRPYEARTKVFIIDNAHNLTPEAANALLKILEEPPKDSLIILVCAKPALLFKTIISRCQVVHFSPLQRKQLEEILKSDYALDRDNAHFLAYFSEGRLGSALRLKDAEIFAQKNKVIDFFLLPKGASLASVLQDCPVENKEELRLGLNILASWFRDLYLVKVGQVGGEFIHLDRKQQILKLGLSYGMVELDEILNSISNACLLLEQNVNTRLLVSNLSACINYTA